MPSVKRGLFEYIRDAAAGHEEADFPELVKSIVRAINTEPNRAELEAELVEVALDGWIGEEPVSDRDHWIRKGVTEMLYVVSEFR